VHARTLTGRLDEVLNWELQLRTTLRREQEDIPIAELLRPAVWQAMRDAYLEALQKVRRVFKPMKFLWKNTCNLDVDVHLSGPGPPKFQIKGRKIARDRFKVHIKFWGRDHLSNTPDIDASDRVMEVQLYHRPTQLPTGDAEFRSRLRNVTSPLAPSRIFDLCVGPKATRETRMEVVANIALGQDFECKLTGGFIRDWIVRGDVKHPTTAPKDWVEPGQGFVKYEIQEGVLPKDLDLELSPTRYFDANRFITAVRECGIEVDYFEHIAQRYVFLFERERGPFTADFIEPHFAMLHTTADFDVNTLCCVNYPDLIGLKRDYKNDQQERLNVDDVIANCVRQEMVQTKSGVGVRLTKMQARGWKLIREVHYLPVNERAGVTVLPIAPSAPEFQRFKDLLAKMTKYGPGRLKDM
jgi:hypothetical protein